MLKRTTLKIFRGKYAVRLSSDNLGMLPDIQNVSSVYFDSYLSCFQSTKSTNVDHPVLHIRWTFLLPSKIINQKEKKNNALIVADIFLYVDFPELVQKNWVFY